MVYNSHISRDVGGRHRRHPGHCAGLALVVTLMLALAIPPARAAEVATLVTDIN